MTKAKMVILTKPFYKVAEAAQILQRSYTTFYNLTRRNELTIIVNGQKFIKAETIMQLFSKYRTFDDCTMSDDAPEVY